MMDANEERMIQIDVWNTIAEDFPDGAYLQFMQVEKGVTVDELVAYAEWKEKRQGGDPR